MVVESLGEGGGVRGTHLLTHVNVDHLAPLPAPPGLGQEPAGGEGGDICGNRRTVHDELRHQLPGHRAPQDAPTIMSRTDVAVLRRRDQAHVWKPIRRAGADAGLRVERERESRGRSERSAVDFPRSVDQGSCRTPTCSGSAARRELRIPADFCAALTLETSAFTLEGVSQSPPSASLVRSST